LLLKDILFRLRPYPVTDKAGGILNSVSISTIYDQYKLFISGLSLFKDQATHLLMSIGEGNFIAKWTMIKASSVRFRLPLAAAFNNSGTASC